MQGEWVGAGTCLAFHEIVDGDRKGEEKEEDGRGERERCCGAVLLDEVAGCGQRAVQPGYG